MQTEVNIINKHIALALDELEKMGLENSYLGSRLVPVVETAIREAYLTGKEDRLAEKVPTQPVPDMQPDQKSMFLFMMHLKAVTNAGFTLHHKTTRFFRQQEKLQFQNAMGICEKLHEKLLQHPLLKANAFYLDNQSALFNELSEQAFRAANGARLLAVVECFQEGLLFIEGAAQPFNEAGTSAEKEAAA